MKPGHWQRKRRVPAAQSVPQPVLGQQLTIALAEAWLAANDTTPTPNARVDPISRKKLLLLCTSLPSVTGTTSLPRMPRFLLMPTPSVLVIG